MQDKNTWIIYRNYKEDFNVKKILDIKHYCKSRGLKFVLSNNNVKLAIKLNLDGAYIPSFNKNFNHLTYKLKKGFILIGSAHNLKDIRIKEKQKVDKVFLSSIFKKNNNFLGINKFKFFSNLSKKKVIALGGVSKTNLQMLVLLNLVNLEGFAGISYFRNKKKAPKRGLLIKYLLLIRMQIQS